MNKYRTFTGNAKDGFKCFRSIPRHAHLKTKAAEAYQELVGDEPNWFASVFSMLFEVGFFCYFLFALDLYYDLDLIETYREKSETYGRKDNTTLIWTRREFR